MSEAVRAKAIVTKGDKLIDDYVTLPALGAHEILVRVHYAAFNPTDGLAFGLQAFGDGAILGCDFAGEVEEVGEQVLKFAPGDRVATFIWGGERPGVGAYSELCIADERLAFNVPSNITLDQAATIPLAAATAYLALFSSDCLKLDQAGGSQNPILILGGSSTVGSYANQIAKLHNIRTISTTSSRNASEVTKDGTEKTFDYHDPDVESQIRDAYPVVNTVFDTIGNPKSVESIAKILESRSGSTLCTVRPGKAGTEPLAGNVDKITDVFVFTVFPKEHTYRGKAHWPINYENHALGKQFFDRLPDLISQGQIRPRPVKNLGNLTVDTVMQAMDLTKKGQVSNEKLCFTVSQGNA